MKRYRLLKDLPTFRAGDLFYISKDGDLKYEGLNYKEVSDSTLLDGGLSDTGIVAYAKQTLEKFPTILTDWFEKVEEPTNSIHWKPKFGDRYFILDNATISPVICVDMLRDHNAWRTGRVFRTEEECEKARDRELAEVRLRRTSNFKPDFNNKNTGNGYVVGYDYLNKKLFIERVLFRDYGEVVYYETKEEAKISVEENREDWLTYFGIKKDWQ